MFGIICAVYGKDTALEIVNAMLNNMHMTAALGYVITEYRKGKVQRECVYYLLRKYHELTLKYRKLIETYIFGNDHPIEAGLITIFMTLPYYKKYKSTTLFQTACYRLGRNAVVKIIEDTLQQQQHSASSSSSSSSLSSRSSMNTMLALMYAATINDKNNNRHDQTQTVHVDDIYFLLRQQPDVLLRCSSNSNINTSSSNSPTPIEAEDAARDNSINKVVSSIPVRKFAY